MINAAKPSKPSKPSRVQEDTTYGMQPSLASMQPTSIGLPVNFFILPLPGQNLKRVHGTLTVEVVRIQALGLLVILSRIQDRKLFTIILESSALSSFYQS